MSLRYFPICDLCVAGEGAECHTPECALFLRDVPADGLIEAFARPTNPPTEDDMTPGLEER